MLERYFRLLAMEGGEFTRIGRWWDRRGENEIDMICEDELSDRAVFYEVKRQNDEISIGKLKQKAEVMLQATRAFKGYKIGYEGLSMEEMWIPVSMGACFTKVTKSFAMSQKIYFFVS